MGHEPNTSEGLGFLGFHVHSMGHGACFELEDGFWSNSNWHAIVVFSKEPVDANLAPYFP